MKWMSIQIYNIINVLYYSFRSYKCMVIEKYFISIIITHVQSFIIKAKSKIKQRKNNIMKILSNEI